jgi:hypothetical protein
MPVERRAEQKVTYKNLMEEAVSPENFRQALKAGHQLEGWIRRHIRKFFWLRWHKPAGRKRKLRSLGLKGHLLKVAHSSKGAWHLAATGSLNTALSNEFLRRSGFLLPSDLADARRR